MPTEGPTLFIATPTAGSTVTSAFLTSLLALTASLQREHISHQFLPFDGANLVKSRNFLANYFLQRTQATHLLFLDSDMRFQARTIFEMLSFAKPVVGCAYPKRNLDPVALVRNTHEAVSRREPVDAAAIIARSFAYPMAIFDADRPAPAEGGRVEIVNGFIEVSKIGTAILLIERSVFDTMVAARAVDRYDDLGDPALDLANVHGFFDLINPGDGRALLSEDLSFCYRWQKRCGGAIWCKIDHEVGHQGPFLFSAIPANGILHHGAPSDH
jgi:hypothetical protein